LLIAIRKVWKPLLNLIPPLIVATNGEKVLHDFGSGESGSG